METDKILKSSEYWLTFHLEHNSVILVMLGARGVLGCLNLRKAASDLHVIDSKKVFLFSKDFSIKPSSFLYSSAEIGIFPY